MINLNSDYSPTRLVLAEINKKAGNRKNLTVTYMQPITPEVAQKTIDELLLENAETSENSISGFSSRIILDEVLMALNQIGGNGKITWDDLENPGLEEQEEF